MIMGFRLIGDVMGTWYKVGIIFLTVVFAVVIERLVNRGKLKRSKRYSYQAVVMEGVKWLILSIALCLFVYVWSGSLEASVTLEAFLLALIISGCMKALYVERQIKKRSQKREK